MVLREAFGAELAAIDRMIGIAADGDRAVVACADQHAAADRAIAAGGAGPAIGDARRGDVAELGIVGVGVLRGERVEAEEALQVQAASRRKNDAAIFFGTTVTKNRYRDTISPLSARQKPIPGCPLRGSTIPPTISSARRATNQGRRSFARRRTEARSSNSSEADMAISFS